MLDVLGSLISAGANLLQGSLNRSSQEQWNNQQLAWAREQSGIQQGQFDRNMAMQQNQFATNLAQQMDFAQHGFGWRVQDAVANGLHPLIGAGGQGANFSPVSVGNVSGGGPVSLGGEAPKFDFGSLGQDISRAAKAMADSQQREAVDLEKARQYAVEGLSLKNDLLRQEVINAANRNSRAAGVLGPPLPRPGPPRSVDGLALKEDDMKQKEGDAPAQKFSRPFGYYLEHNPWFSDGQVAEDRYGDSELLSTAKALVNMGADHVYTGYRMLPDNPFPAGSGSRIKRFRKGSYTAPSYRPWAE